GALRGKKRKGKKQCRVADKNIAIDDEHPGNLRGIENKRARDGKKMAPEAPRDEKTRERPQGFSRERASRRPPNAERKPIYEGDVEGNIAKIDQNLKGKRYIGPPAPDDRAHKGIICKRERRRPDPNVEIKPPRAGDFGSGGKRAKADPGDRRLEANHNDADGHGNDQGAQERSVLLAPVICPQGLRGEPRGSHAQETKTPKEKVEHDSRGGDGAEKIRLSEPADHRRIGNAEQRRRQMGERHRQGEPRYAGVADLRRIYSSTFIGGHHAATRSAGVAHIHEPQHQPDGNDDRGSRKDIFGDLTNRIETKAPDAIDELYDPAKYVLWPNVEPHQKSADDQGHENKAQEYAARRAAQKTVNRRLVTRPIRVGGARILPRCRPMGRHLRRRTVIFAHAKPRTSKPRNQKPWDIILADSLRGVSTSRQLKRDGGGFAATDAQRRRTALQPVFLHRREQGHDDSGTRCADRMAERTSAAMHIDFFMRQTEFPHRRHGDNREGLVDLEKIDVRQRPAGFVHQLSQR